MAYTEKITWQGRSLTLAREHPPTKVADARGDDVRLEALVGFWHRNMEHDELTKKVLH